MVRSRDFKFKILIYVYKSGRKSLTFIGVAVVKE
jgi:hypothetical protein